MVVVVVAMPHSDVERVNITSCVAESTTRRNAQMVITKMMISILAPSARRFNLDSRETRTAELIVKRNVAQANTPSERRLPAPTVLLDISALARPIPLQSNAHQVHFKRTQVQGSDANHVLKENSATSGVLHPAASAAVASLMKRPDKHLATNALVKSLEDPAARRIRTTAPRSEETSHLILANKRIVNAPIPNAILVLHLSPTTHIAVMSTTDVQEATSAVLFFTAAEVSIASTLPMTSSLAVAALISPTRKAVERTALRSKVPTMYNASRVNVLSALASVVMS
ncbi:hypothetical protein FRC03_000919 [Tulasnella sp. 419]|nr:hypothetical protein FRC03_000919 [Tulasnella sp. 419]